LSIFQSHCCRKGDRQLAPVELAAPTFH
jgi:hypothetical protein